MKIRLSDAATLFHADCRDALKLLPDCSVDSVVSDPPYELGFMGKKWDDSGIAFSPALWSEVLRVLKPGGHLVAFGGTRTYHRMACAIEDAGFEIRDCLQWIYGSGFPKSHDVSKGIDKAAGAEREVVGRRTYGDGHVQNSSPDKLAPPIGTFVRVQDDRLETAPATPEAAQWQGWGTALKPACEPIVLARKPLSEGTVAANVLKWGTGAINVDGCRVEAPGVDLGRNNNARKQEDGTSYVVQKTTMRVDNSNGLGRWPANVIHDGSEEVVAGFPVTGGSGTPREKSPNEGSIWAIGAERSSVPGGATPVAIGSAARFFYQAKASKADRAGSKHPTVKPIALMCYLARLITPPGGTILDPFAGSGTTGAAAIAEGFDCILVEREAEYVADIKRRFGVQPPPCPVALPRCPVPVPA